MANHGFEAFRPGDQPYDLGNGAARRLAALTGVAFGEQPNAEEIQAGFDAWGRQKEFQANIEGLQTRLPDGRDLAGEVADIVNDSGILLPVEPRNVDGESASEFDQVVIGGGVTNWIYRRARHVDELTYRGWRFGHAVLLGSDRVMASDTESNLHFVRQWRANHEGALPTEADYLRHEVSARLGHVGIESTLLGPHKLGFAAMVKMAADEGLLEGAVYVAQNAPAGSTFADVRQVVDDERLYFGSDGVSIARTRKEMDPKNALRYQNPFSAASALIRWVKAVHDVNQSRGL